MLTVPADQFKALNQTIKCWQYLLGWSTFLAAIFGIAVVVLDSKCLAKYRKKLRLPLGIISGLFWVSTVVCGIKVNTKTSQLQQQYAKQTEDAETRIANLKPTVDSVKGTVDELAPFVNDTLSPEVDHLTNTVGTIQPQVRSIASQVKSLGPSVNALVDNANRIRTFRLELSYPQDSFRRDSIESLAGYHPVSNLGPEIRCDGMTIPLYPLSRSIENERTNISTNVIYFNLIKPDQLEGQRIGILDTCHVLSINILGLEINNDVTKTTHNMFYAIKYLDVQLVINGMYLKKIHIDTPEGYWTPRIEDAGYVTFNLGSNPLKLSQQYTQSYNSSSDSTNRSR